MKKILITMAVLTGMVAGAMVFSSFTAPKNNDETVCSQISMNDGWRRVGKYTGKSDDGQYLKFTIWEKEGSCNAYYWVVDCQGVNGVLLGESNPDETRCDTGAVRKNSEGRWYCAYGGRNYFIDF